MIFVLKLRDDDARICQVEEGRITSLQATEQQVEWARLRMSVAAEATGWHRIPEQLAAEMKLEEIPEDADWKPDPLRDFGVDFGAMNKRD